MRLFNTLEFNRQQTLTKIEELEADAVLWMKRDIIKELEDSVQKIEELEKDCKELMADYQGLGAQKEREITDLEARLKDWAREAIQDLDCFRAEILFGGGYSLAVAKWRKRSEE